MDRPRLTTLVTWAVVGTYLLVALGATAAADAGPVLATAHHAAAVFVGLLLVATTIVAHRHETARGVRLGMIVVLIAYPIQAGIGLAGRSGVQPGGGQLHLLGGIAVFAVLLVTLIHQLETTATASGSEDGSIGEGSRTDHSVPASPASSSPDTSVSSSSRSSSDTSASPTSRSSSDTSASPTSRSSSDTSVSSSSRSSSDSAAGASVSNLRSLTIGDRLRAYLELTKPRLMWLLCLLALAGMGLATATGATLDGVTVVATLGGGVLAIGAAGTFNHVYERDRDRRMQRTADRPIATDRVGVRRAVGFALLLIAASMAILLAFVNVLATVLTGLAVIYYAYVYTVLLKPTTRWNTVIGGGSGALPALIGYAAVTGTVGVPALLLAVIVCCWTPAHFYNLAIAHREDYARADYPMLPVVAGIPAARRRILVWLGTTLVAAALLGIVTDLGLLYALATTALGAVFVRSVVQQYDADRHANDPGQQVDGAGQHANDPGQQVEAPSQQVDGATIDDADDPIASPGAARAAAYRSFHASNAYLGAILAAILLETLAV